MTNGGWAGRPGGPGAAGRALAFVFLIAAGALLRSQGAPGPIFVESASATGLAFTHVNGATGQYYLPEVMGAGVALFDYDNDGDLDVFLVQSGPLDAAHPGVANVPPAPGQGGAASRAAASTGPTSRLFRNDLTVGPGGKRTLRFTDVTAQSHAGVRGYGMGVATGDYDNDGYLDLFVTAFGPATLLHNNGDGTFTDVTKSAGIVDTDWTTSAAFVDYDRDGHLDLFVAHYVDFTIAGTKLCNDSLGARDYCGPRAFRPVPDRLYRNDGRGHFVDVTGPSGVQKADGAGLGVAIGDYDGDGWLDLYVANDGTPNQLWINQKDGTFADEGLLSGSSLSASGNPEGSMGIASGDFDLDGDEDLFVTNIAGETSVLYINDGHAAFEDARARVGLASLTAAFTGFGTDWVDYDNDGWPDLFVANGAVNVVESQRGQPFPFRMRNQLFRNIGGRRFEDVSAVAGPAFAHAEISRGAAFGDIDNDGDVDIVFTNNGGPVRLLVNQIGARNHWLGVRLTDGPRNRFGIGARVGVERTGQPTLWRRVRTDGSYLSASDVRVHFGLGPAATPAASGASRPPNAVAVVVEWPDGARERWTGIELDRVHVLRRGTGKQP